MYSKHCRSLTFPVGGGSNTSEISAAQEGGKIKFEYFYDRGLSFITNEYNNNKIVILIHFLLVCL